MAILFITHKFPPSIGGMQKQSYELINGIRQKAKVYTIIQSPVENKIFFFLRLKARVKRMLADHSDIKVIHCNDGVVASFCSWLTAYVDIPVTATIHGLDIVFPNYFYQRFIVPRLKRFDQIFAVSEATAEACISRGFSRSKVSIVHNGVDHNIVSHEVENVDSQGIDFKKNRVIISVGRAVRRKGFAWFVKSVLPHLPEDVIYVLIGPKDSVGSFGRLLNSVIPDTIVRQWQLFWGSSSDSIELQRHESAARFFHLSGLSLEEMTSLISKSELMIMPNIHVDGDMEGFGLVALEAGLCGTYVIASDVDGIPSAIAHGGNGHLIPSQSVEAWRSTIMELLSDKALLEKRGIEARSHVLNTYSWEKMCNDYFEQFQRLSCKSTSLTQLSAQLSLG